MRIEKAIFPNSSRAPDQSGAVLLLVLLLLVVLITLAGLAIDTALISTSRAQQRRTAEYLALSSLREYSRQPSTASVQTRLLNARDMAQKLVNINIMLGQGFRENHSLPDEVGPLGSGGSISNPEGPSGRIIPGVWNFVPTLDNNGRCVGDTPCPCNLDGSWAGACFEELDVNNTTREINAFRADLKLREESPLKTIFSRVLGPDHIYFQSTATAAILPLHTVFLLDLSRSSHIESHVPYERAGIAKDPNASESAYRLATEKCLSSTNYTNFCGLSQGGGPKKCSLVGGLFPDIYTEIYGGTVTTSTGTYSPTRQTRTPGSPSDTTTGDNYRKRFRNDYQCYSVSYTDETGNKSEDYLVDAYRGMTKDEKPYDGPEPLTTMLSAIHHGLDRFVERHVPGDLVGAIGFDSSTQIDVRRFPLEPPVITSSGQTNDNFRMLRKITDISLVDRDSDGDGTIDTAIARRDERIQKKMFFVRTDAESNIAGALDQAKTMLFENGTAASPKNPMNAKNTVILLSDGITNCQINGNCHSKDETFIKSAIDQSVQFVTDNFTPHNIQFDFLMLGDLSLPHTLLKKGALESTKNQCMTENEALENNLNFVNFNTLDGSLAKATSESSRDPLTSSYFYYANRLAEAAFSTKGLFRPLRDPCSYVATPGGKSCAQGALLDELDTACKAASSNGAVLPNLAGRTDNMGRLFCDPRCRSRRQQAEEAIDEILSRSPFVLVQ